MALDEDEVYLGYIAGFTGDALPKSYSRAFWHGWRNGCADSGRIDLDRAMMRLAWDVSTKRGK